MKKIGIITFHAAYNFGSVLQAYALQEYLRKKGFEVEIINYRMKEQKDCYKMFRTDYGVKIFINDTLGVFYLNKKIERKKSFEQFISDYLVLTQEFADPLEFSEYNDKYDVYISGSDQIWNKHANELHNVEWKYMEPYLLNKIHGRKISYASSIGNMKDDMELNHLIEYIRDYHRISMREEASAKLISKYLNKRVESVLDPTFLLKRQDWISRFKLKKRNEKKYILFYSLAGRKKLNKFKKLITDIEKKGYVVKYITPFFQFRYGDRMNFVNCLEYGPYQFLDAIYNSECVITDSYHGTILSINLNKNFYSINGDYESDYRKTSVLQKLDLMSRSIGSGVDISELKFDNINYEIVESKLEVLRKHSKEYLINAINDDF